MQIYFSEAVRNLVDDCHCWRVAASSLVVGVVMSIELLVAEALPKLILKTP